MDEAIGIYFVEEVEGGVDKLMEDDAPETAGEFWCDDEYATDYEIGSAIVDQLGIEGVSRKDMYFDYSGYGRDIRLGGKFIQTRDGIFEINR